MDITELVEFRASKDSFFSRSHQSPLPHDSRHNFAGLKYYEPNDELVFTLEVVPGDRSRLQVQTTDGQERTYERSGVVTFDVGDDAVQLTLYSTGHHGYFVPFRDATSGKETYGAGRYLDIEPNDDGTITLDFNYAYNPFCVYDDAYSCPLPPTENWLKVPIEAGELDWG